MKKQYTLTDLMDILKTLRGENGCPWDRVQTHESLKKSMIEEAYEALDALDAGDDKLFANELGDVLLQVAFHAQIASERGVFGIGDVLNEVCTKLITRHTHVFGTDRAGSEAEALGTWEENKKKEKGQKTYTEALRDVPGSLPALLRAEKVQKKAASAGFDWEDAAGALEKAEEELRELREAVGKQSPAEIEEEYGDLLFALVNVGRHLKLTPELALTAASNKFIGRFAKMEEAAKEEKKELNTMNLQEMDALWDKIKQKY